MKAQRCYNGCRYLGPRAGPSPKNVERIDMGAMPMIARMQRRGLQVDLTHFARLDVELTQDMDRVTEEVHQLTGHYINLGSGDQVADLLFKKLGLQQAKLKMTSSGERESVEDEVLTAIQHQHPVVGKCLEYKEFEKLRGTYVRPMPKLAKRTALGKWRIYPNFRTTRVPSGRLACADPNLLAMPTRTERGRDIRKGFITDSGWKFLSVDLSQIEVRVAAHRSQDENLCNVYTNEEDVYSDFAIQAFRLQDKRHKPEGKKWQYPGVDPMEHRRPAKICVLASIYDVTAGGLQAQMPIICASCNKPAVCLKCNEGKPHIVPDECIQHNCHSFRALWIEEKCQYLITAFYSRYSGLMRMRIDDHNYIRQHAYIVDDWGRLQHITAIRSVLPWVGNTALREGANLPEQGTAQGVIKVSMAAVEDDLAASGLYAAPLVHPLLQIHDELLFEVREDVIGDVEAVTVYRFEDCVRLRVPLKASAANADSWGLLEK